MAQWRLRTGRTNPKPDRIVGVAGELADRRESQKLIKQDLTPIYMSAPEIGVRS